MTEWEPATDAEAAMQDALRVNDQEQYFRILAGTQLLLPVPVAAMAGGATAGWGTWTTGGRTHILAFTSDQALRACLAGNAGPARRVSLTELANAWPNLEWWLAVNPGLPIEGYLPAWYVVQLSRGDVRLPGRRTGRMQQPVRARVAVPTQQTHPPSFTPANEVEQKLLAAADEGDSNSVLSTLLLAKVLLPVAAGSAGRPGDDGFVWRTETSDGETCVVVFTSPERLADHSPGPLETVDVRFAQLIRHWPDDRWSLTVNPGTPVSVKLIGSQIVALASRAAEVGLGDESDDATSAEPVAAPVGQPRPHAPEDPRRPTMMQKVVPPAHLAYYLERGYDRVSGFVHRVDEVSHLNTPAKLIDALGLAYPGSPFSRDAREVHVLRWPAHRPSLYRIPYGGQDEAAMRAMQGWVIERPPFRGNGFAPGDSGDIIAEFKVDSIRLPHGAQLWRIGADGTEKIVAIFDSDAPTWRRVGEE